MKSNQVLQPKLRTHNILSLWINVFIVSGLLLSWLSQSFSCTVKNYLHYYISVMIKSDMLSLWNIEERQTVTLFALQQRHQTAGVFVFELHWPGVVALVPGGSHTTLGHLHHAVRVLRALTQLRRMPGMRSRSRLTPSGKETFKDT